MGASNEGRKAMLREGEADVLFQSCGTPTTRHRMYMYPVEKAGSAPGFLAASSNIVVHMSRSNDPGTTDQRGEICQGCPVCIYQYSSACVA